MQTEHS